MTSLTSGEETLASHSAPESYYASPSPPHITSSSFQHNDSQSFVASSSASAAAKFLQAPALSRSYSSPVVPLKYLPHNTPLIQQNPTFSNLYFEDTNQFIQPKQEFVSGAAL